MIHRLRHIFANGQSVPVILPHKPRSHIMSMSALLSTLTTQDDDQVANVMAEALNSDQRIRALQGLPIAFDAAGLRRVANALAAHAVGLEAEVGRTAPKLPRIKPNDPPQPPDEHPIRSGFTDRT